MRRLAAIAAVLLAIAACSSSVGVARSGVTVARARPAARTVLVLTQTLGFHHASIPAAIDALRRTAARDGRYRVAFLRSASRLTPAALKSAAAVVFLLTTGELPFSRSQKHALLAFVHGGGGLVGFHSATDTFHHWPGYIKLIGAEFSHHPAPTTERVIVEDRSTPATRLLPHTALPSKGFLMSSNTILVPTLSTSWCGSTPRAAARTVHWVWCRRSARGRVFSDALGHFPRTWSDPRQLELVSGGIAWAAGIATAPSC